MTQKPSTEKPDVKDAEGIKNISAPWTERPQAVEPQNIPSLQTNIHYRDAVNNIIRQVFSGLPELWVTDIDGETVDDLTAELKADFARLHCYDLMQHVLTDHYGYGAFIYSPGIAREGGKFIITELRHLPCESFLSPPPYKVNVSTPNRLLPGIIVTEDGETEIWQTNPHTSNQTRIENARTVVPHGEPQPSGRAYMEPVYYVIARIDFASKAQMQQLNRIGAPVLLPKVSDTVDDEAINASLQTWAKKFVKSWGKDTISLIPQGIEFPPLNIREGSVARDFVEQCVAWIRTYTNPISDMQQAGTGIGTSDSGRMEIWATFIASEQNTCETWLEDLFTQILEANGYLGHRAHIQLKRPSVDKAALRREYILAAYQAKAITIPEIRDNMTDILDLQETTPELELQLKQQYQSAPTLFGNVGGVDFTRDEERVMSNTEKLVNDINEQTRVAINKIMNYSDP